MRFRLRPRWVLLIVAVLFYITARLLLASGGNAPTDIVIGSKNFTESLLAGEIYALSLEKAGYHVARRFNLGGTLIAHAALQKGEIDLYPEYTGTGLLTILHQPPDPDEQRVYRLLVREYSTRWHLRWLTPSPLNNSNALVITRELARRYNVYTLSQMSALASQFTLAAVPEFAERPDGLPGLQQHYGGFAFRQVQLYNNGLKYRVLAARQADVTVGFTTDGALSDPDFVVLADDRHFWPTYHLTPLIREDALLAAPRAADALNRVSARMDTALMQRLNAAVDQDGQDYRVVARAFVDGLQEETPHD